MKKMVAVLLTFAISIPMATTAFAAPEEREAPSTAITFEYKNDPTYTVTIPETLTMEEQGTAFDIIAEDVANLDNQKISVTIAGTDQFRNQMTLQGKTETGSNATLRYTFTKEDGTVIETTGQKDEVVGVEVASFTHDGTATLTATPILTGSSSIKKGVTYTGSITYGIELVDLA